MNSTTAYQMLAAVADEVSDDNDLPEDAVAKLLATEPWVEAFTESLYQMAHKANPKGENQAAEDAACADFLQNSHARVLAGLRAVMQTKQSDFFTHSALTMSRSQLDNLAAETRQSIEQARAAVGIE